RTQNTSLKSRLIFTRCYSKIDTNEFTRTLLSTDYSYLTDLTRYNENLVRFENDVLAKLDAVAPQRKRIVKSRPSKWFDSECANLSKQRDHLKEIAESSGRFDDWIRYKDIRNKCSITQRRKKKQYADLKAKQKVDSVNAWNYVNELTNFRGSQVEKITVLQ